MPFEENKGIAGFYGSLHVSGAFAPSVYNMEVHSPGGLVLDIPVVIRGKLNFLEGDIRSAGSGSSTCIRFNVKGKYTNATDRAKVRGIVGVRDQEEFIFPVGDREHLHALKFEAMTGPLKSRCSYIKGPPKGRPLPASPFGGLFGRLDKISSHGYWKLESQAKGRITINWNTDSHISTLNSRAENITLAGWSIQKQKWEILGPVKISGDLNKGYAESGPFVPDDYSAITFGSSAMATFAVNAGNFLLTPNGDGINDFLQIPAAHTNLNNHIRIYDRFGNKVFEQDNYKGRFDGTGNVNRIWIEAEDGLPQGIYFYLLNLKKHGRIYQGFLYLKR